MHGVSTHSVDELVKAWGMMGVTKCEVSRVSFFALLDADFIGPDNSAVTTQAVKLAAEAACEFLRTQVSSFEAACRLVAACQGIRVLPNASAETFRASMKLRLVEL